MRLPGDAEIEEGSPVGLLFAPERVVLFDSEGQALDMLADDAPP